MKGRNSEYLQKPIWAELPVHMDRVWPSEGALRTHKVGPKHQAFISCSALTLLQKFPSELPQTLQAHVQAESGEAKLWWDIPKPPWEPVSLRCTSPCQEEAASGALAELLSAASCFFVEPALLRNHVTSFRKPHLPNFATEIVTNHSDLRISRMITTVRIWTIIPFQCCQVLWFL